MKKLEVILLSPSVVSGFILALLNSIKPFSYVESISLICLITIGTIFLLRKKLINIYKENTRTYSLWTIEFYSGRSVKRIFAHSYLFLLFVFASDWVFISKFHISNFLEYFVYYTILQFCRLFFLSYIFLHSYHLKYQKS